MASRGVSRARGPKEIMRTTTALPLLALLVPAAGCDRGSGTYPIEEKRVIDEPRPEQRIPADTRRRLAPQGPMGSGVDPHAGDPHAAAPTGPLLDWDLPAGWEELPPTPLRTANFVVPGQDRLECYVTVLPGGGGGIAANVNRWRKQMGLDAISDADVAALPTVKMFGVDAPYVEIDGTFKGAGVETGAEGFTMAATVVERSGAAITAKLVGPAAAVRAEVERFKAMCSSLRDAAPAPRGAEAPVAGGGFEPAALKWTAPEGWVQGPAKQMRVVTFTSPDAPGAECYVTVLGGAAGGVEANVNRWRSQLSQPALSAAEIAALPKLTVLGREASMVEIDGGAAGLFGLVCDLGTHSVFVKMTGPMEGLRKERERFIAFCKSLS